MPTVPETLKALYALQLVDTQVQRAKRAQAALDNGTAAATAAASAHAEAQARRGEWQKLAGNLKDTELKSAAVETKRKNYQGKLYQGTVTNPKELGNIEKEIEALTAASVAALTVYDMCKAVDRGMRIDGLRVVHKDGGKSGAFRQD